MHYYLEFGGGLGDIFNQIFNYSSYRGLEDLRPSDTATIAIICHNPFAYELFEWHPNRPQIEVRQFPYMNLNEDVLNRQKLGLAGALLTSCRDDTNFFPSNNDMAILHSLSFERTLVISASAGLPERSIPNSIVDRIIDTAIDSGFKIFVIGRTFSRHGRREYVPTERENVSILIDKLSVPGTIELLRRSCGLITCHSAINILGWHVHIPQFLLLPKSVWMQHFFRGRNEWNFGILQNQTFCCLFDSYSDELYRHFLNEINPKGISVADKAYHR